MTAVMAELLAKVVDKPVNQWLRLYIKDQHAKTPIGDSNDNLTSSVPLTSDNVFKVKFEFDANLSMKKRSLFL